MSNSMVTRPSGVHPDALPPDFEAWDEPVPTHPAGQVTAYDEQSGLPIVRRKPADTRPAAAASKPSAPEKKEEAAETKPAKPEPKPAKEDTKPAAAETKQSDPETPAEMTKGAPVKLKDGSTGKLSWYDKVSGIARIRRDADGKSISVRKNAFEVQPHTQVSAHVRRIPTK